MELDLFKIAGVALDEAGFTLDDETKGVKYDTTHNLKEHDERYHDGHWDGRSDCVLREELQMSDKADSLETKTDFQSQSEITKARQAELDKIKGAEITDKTAEELLNRADSFTDKDIELFNRAIDYALNGEPAIIIDKPTAKDDFNSLYNIKHKVLKKNIKAHFGSFGNTAQINGLGDIRIDNQSASSIVSHACKIGRNLQFLSVLKHLPELAPRAMIYSVIDRWKGRSGKSVYAVCPIKINDREYVVDFIVSERQTCNRLYIIKISNREKLRGCSSSFFQTTYHTPFGRETSTPQLLPLYQNSGGGVNGDDMRERAKKAIISTQSLLGKNIIAVNYAKSRREQVKGDESMKKDLGENNMGIGEQVMDAEVPSGDEKNSAGMPPDLVLHDKRYHHGHWDGKSKCLYRENREAALAAIKEGETEKDIIDRLNPEDVEGEEIDKADDLSVAKTGIGDDIDKLEQSIPKFKGAAAEVLRGLVEKKKAMNIQPLLDKMASAIDWSANNNSADNQNFTEQMTKLANLVKSGALNELLGLGKVPDGAKPKPRVANATELQKRKDGIAKDMAMLKEKMGMASPRLAQAFQAQMLAMQKQMKDIDDQLNGKKSSSASKSAEEDAKAKKKAEKEAKKKAVDASKLGQNGFAPGVAEDSAPILGKTAVLSSENFKKEMSTKGPDNKIFALSDFHDAGVKDIETGDVGTVICAGDFTKHGATSHSKNIDMVTAIKSGTEWLQKKFFKWCDKNKDKDIVLIAGNHDHFLGDSTADNIQWPSNVKYLKDTETTIRGMRVYGTPWCEKRKGAAKTASMSSSVAQQPFEIDDVAIKEKFDQIPEGLDILVVHQTPLFDYKDEKGNDVGPDVAFVGGQMKHCGSSALTEAIKRAKPKLVICGHLHDGDHRPHKIGDTVVVNGAYVANRGDPAWTAHEIGIDVNHTQSGDTEVGFIVNGDDNHQLSK